MQFRRIVLEWSSWHIFWCCRGVRLPSGGAPLEHKILSGRIWPCSVRSWRPALHPIVHGANCDAQTRCLGVLFEGEWAHPSTLSKQRTLPHFCLRKVLKLGFVYAASVVWFATHARTQIQQKTWNAWFFLFQRYGVAHSTALLWLQESTRCDVFKAISSVLKIIQILRCCIQFSQTMHLRMFFCQCIGWAIVFSCALSMQLTAQRMQSSRHGLSSLIIIGQSSSIRKFSFILFYVQSGSGRLVWAPALLFLRTAPHSWSNFFSKARTGAVTPARIFRQGRKVSIRRAFKEMPKVLLSPHSDNGMTLAHAFADAHTASNTMDLLRPVKLSGEGSF